MQQLALGSRRRICIALVLLAGCPTRDVTSGKMGGENETTALVEVQPNRDLDVLFVIDNSDSMGEEQASLATNFPTFMDALAKIEGGLPNVHIGVVSSDLGIAPFTGDNCNNSGGDNGVLQNKPRGACQAPMNGARFISDVASSDGTTRVRNYAGALPDVFSCIAKLGTSGCGYERHLESMHRALDPGTVENAGFLRPGAYLAVIVIGDEDDCSAAVPQSFYDTAAALDDADPAKSPLGKVLWRCTGFGVLCDGAKIGRGPATYQSCVADGAPEDLNGLLYHPQFFVDGLRSLKSDPNLLFTAVIAGPTTPFAIGPKDGVDQLLNSCPASSAGNAAPAVRLKYFTDQFGPHGKFVSICDANLAPALNSIAQALRAIIVTSCLAGAIDLTDADPAEPGLQPQCAVADVTSGAESVIPRCAMTDASTPVTTTLPCWWVDTDQAACGGTQTHLKLHVERGGAEVPPNTSTTVRCATLAE